ncbi:hypothetical protein Daesc_000672 [Daldinia eschscholtzii]|uniref:Uncharacterized protein n=1 Tax=Daldinia eschscholtzii TaxID=292717 RepID=A0AAX6MZN3_9PEZI
MTGHADTEEVTDEVRETFIHHNRIYQRCSVDRRIYLVPVDEVCKRQRLLFESDPQTDIAVHLAG